MTVTVSQTFLVFGDLDSFEDYWLDVSYNISVRIYHVFFHHLLGLRVLGYKTTEMKYHFRHVTGTHYQCYLSPVILTLIISVRLCLSGLFTEKLLSPRPHTSFFLFNVAFAYLFSSFYFQLFWILFYTYCDTHIVGFLLPNLMHSISPFFSFPL